MSSRPAKRARILSSEEEDSDGTDWAHEEVSTSGSQQPSASRNRRGPSAPITSTPSDPNKQSHRLTVKSTPSRLREVITNKHGNSREKLGRSSKRAPIIDRSESDEDDVGDDDGEGEEEEEDEDGDEEEIATDAEEDVDEDEEDDAPAPKIKINGPGASKKMSPGRVLKQGAHTKSVEDKQIHNASSDEELSSEPDDEADGDEDEDGEEDEDMEMMDEDGADLDDTINSAAIAEGELDSEDGEGSESGTPDPSKLTRRQRGEAESDLMALSNEAQKKKFFTAEQITMRRAEMARRRKDLSDKRNQNEKEDTLRRLLHKPAPKRRSRAQMIADAEREDFGTPGAEGEEARPSKLYIRTVIRADESSVSMPAEWLGTPAGRIFENTTKEAKRGQPSPNIVSRMVEVLD